MKKKFPTEVLFASKTQRIFYLHDTCEIVAEEDEDRTVCFANGDFEEHAEEVVFLISDRGAVTFSAVMNILNRGCESHAEFLPFIWSDIHFESVNPIPVYPPNERAAFDLLQQYPLPPSLVLKTRGLLQSFWLFDKPLRISRADARLRAVFLLMELQNFFEKCAAQHGWKTSNSFNLLHRFPLSGPVGAEPGGPHKLAAVMESRPGCRYSPDIFDAAHEKAMAMIGRKRIV